jgi:hypothetical protein
MSTRGTSIGAAAATAGDATRRSAAQDDDPQPWQSPEDARGWHVVPRVRGAHNGPPLIRVTVSLDAAQSAWLRAEARRTGFSYDELVVKFIEAARAAAEAPSAGTERR